MKINPTRLAVAMAAIWGVSTPRRITAARFLPCPACRGVESLFTVCGTCRGQLRVGVIG